MLNLITNSCELRSKDTKRVRKMKKKKDKIQKENIHIVIEDDTLSLSLSHGWNLNINNFFYYDFDIILNKTLDCIGQIRLDYTEPGFSYRGNVSYFIHEPYQNKHYATKALHLLKTIASLNTSSHNKDLYIATKVDNEHSGKVAMNNGGVLIYNGSVPSDEYINYEHGIKEVKVYQIKINTEKH